MSEFVRTDIVKGLIAAGLATTIFAWPPAAADSTLAVGAKRTIFDAEEPVRGLPMNSVSLRGFAPKNAKVVISQGKSVVGTAEAGDNGRWLAYLASLPPGEHRLSVTANAYKSDIEIITFDPNRPTILQPVTLGKMGPKAVVTGVAEPGSTLQVLLNGRQLGKVTANEMSLWSYETPTVVGTNVITARGLGGHVSIAGYRGIRTKIKPVLIKVQRLSGNLLVRGVATPFGQVRVSNKGRPVGVAQANANGQWTLTYKGRLLGAQFDVVAR